jgi:hypothetical protein
MSNPCGILLCDEHIEDLHALIEETLAVLKPLAIPNEPGDPSPVQSLAVRLEAWLATLEGASAPYTGGDDGEFPF